MFSVFRVLWQITWRPMFCLGLIFVSLLSPCLEVLPTCMRTCLDTRMDTNLLLHTGIRTHTHTDTQTHRYTHIDHDSALSERRCHSVCFSGTLRVRTSCWSLTWPPASLTLGLLSDLSLKNLQETHTDRWVHLRLNTVDWQILQQITWKIVSSFQWTNDCVSWMFVYVYIITTAVTEFSVM